MKAAAERDGILNGNPARTDSGAGNKWLFTLIPLVVELTK